MNSQLSLSLDQLLPPLDMHAHVDPTVTPAQLATLGGAIVFAVTRTLDEAAHVRNRSDPNLIWGVGIHPGLAAAINSFDPARFKELLDDIAFVGEVGLDRKGPKELAVSVLDEVLAAARETRRLCSIHSSGEQAAVLDVLGEDARGMILHWFTGSPSQIQRAAQAGAYFSVNVAMEDHQLNALPPDRLLPETDFPFSQRAGSKRPGDIDVLEGRVAALLARSRDDVRQMWYRNLRALCVSADALGSLPAIVARPTLAA